MRYPFDKIYCLCLSENKSRYQKVIDEFKRVEMYDQLNIWWTCKRKISSVVAEYIPSLHSGYYDFYKRFNKEVYGTVFNCSYEHYSIIKSSYERGMERILICEDDIKFIDNKNVVQKAFTELPSDFNIIKFCNEFNGRQSYLEKYNNQNDLFQSITWNAKNTSTACYALDRKGMKFLIDNQDELFKIADYPFKNLKSSKDFKIYQTRYLVCFPNTNMNSTILTSKYGERNIEASTTEIKKILEKIRRIKNINFKIKNKK